MKKLFVMSGAHPVHVAFAKSINADIYKVKFNVDKKQFFILKGLKILLNSLFLPKNYDVYITESCFYYPTILRKIKLINGKIINLNCSPLQYWMKINRVKGIEKKVLSYLLNLIDGQIFLGKKWAQEFNNNKPYVITYSFISKKNFDSLSKIKPDLNSKNICIIASKDWYYKGLDLLIDSFKIVKKEFPESNLYIIGKLDIPNKYQKVEGVNLLGGVDNIEKIFEKCSLYVHPSRGEVFAVSILEAMCAGLPVIVSDETGNMEIINKNYIVKTDINEISNKIKEYFNLNYTEKQNVSDKNRKINNFKEENIIKEFKEKFEELSHI